MNVCIYLYNHVFTFISRALTERKLSTTHCTMNTSFCCCNSATTQSFLCPPSSPIYIPTFNQFSSIPSQFRVTKKLVFPLRRQSSRRGLPVRAAVVESGREELEKELEEWVVGISDIGRCCGSGGGGERNDIVEVMECLEREAIMGADQGREPTDYYRRAHIFDNSSRLFQALKVKKDTTTTTTTTTQQTQH